MSSAPQQTVYTVGHSNHTQQRLLELLRQHAITAVCDVRSTPYSRWNPQFNREALQRFLLAQGIRYVYLGHDLGAHSSDPACFERGRVAYHRIAQTALFQHGLERLRQGMRRFRIALMCAEKEPVECHRTILISRYVAALGIDIQHILEDGRLESQHDALLRLAESLRLRVGELHLFRSQQDLIEDAYRLQEERIAYRVESEGEETEPILDPAK